MFRRTLSLLVATVMTPEIVESMPPACQVLVSVQSHAPTPVWCSCVHRDVGWTSLHRLGRLFTGHTKVI
jgi:hypothetical protein